MVLICRFTRKYNASKAHNVTKIKREKSIQKVSFLKHLDKSY